MKIHTVFLPLFYSLVLVTSISRSSEDSAQWLKEKNEQLLQNLPDVSFWDEFEHGSSFKKPFFHAETCEIALTYKGVDLLHQFAGMAGSQEMSDLIQKSIRPRVYSLSKSQSNKLKKIFNSYQKSLQNQKQSDILVCDPENAQLINDIEEYLRQESFKVEKYETLYGHQVQQVIHAQLIDLFSKGITRFEEDKNNNNIPLVLKRILYLSIQLVDYCRLLNTLAILC